MAQIPKNIQIALSGAKLTFKINGNPVTLDEEAVDIAAKQNLDKLVSSGELPQHRIQEYWDAHNKFKDNAKKGVYNIDTAGPDSISGMTYEGTASPETLGKNEDGEVSQRGALGRFFTKTVKNDPAAVMSRYNALTGVSIGSLGLKQIQQIEEEDKAKVLKSEQDKQKSELEQKAKSEMESKIPSIGEYIQSTRFGGGSKWEGIWKDLPESEKFDILSKHATNIVGNKDKYFSGKDTSWMDKFKQNDAPYFKGLDDIRDFFSHIHGGEGSEYLTSNITSKPTVKVPEKAAPQNTELSNDTTLEEDKFPSVNIKGLNLPGRPSQRGHIPVENTTIVTAKGDMTPEEFKKYKLFGDKEAVNSFIDSKIKQFTDEGDGLKNISSLNANDFYKKANTYKAIKNELAKGISIQDLMSKTLEEMNTIKDKHEGSTAWIWTWAPHEAKEYKEKANLLERLQDLSKELPSYKPLKKEGGILKGLNGFNTQDLIPEILKIKKANSLIPFVKKEESNLQKLNPLVAKAELSPTILSKPKLSPIKVETSEGVKQSGIQSLVNKIPKLNEEQKLNLRELSRVALLNKFNPDITVEAPLMTASSEIRVPIKGDYTSMGLAAQQAAKLRNSKPQTSDAVLSMLGSQMAEEKAGQIETQGALTDLQARKQAEAQDLSEQQRSAQERSLVANRNIESLSQKTQAERAAKNMLSQQRVQNWDTFLASLNLEKKVKVQQQDQMKKEFALKDLQNQLYSHPTYLQWVKENRAGQVSPETNKALQELNQKFEAASRDIYLGKNTNSQIKFQLGGSISKSEASLQKDIWKEKIKSARSFSDIYQRWMDKKTSKQEKNTDTQSKELYDLVKRALK